MSGGTSFFQRKEIKDIISYLRVCANHDDDINLLRILNTPRRGIGRKTLEVLNEIAKEYHCSLWEAISKVIAPITNTTSENTTDLENSRTPWNHNSDADDFSLTSHETAPLSDFAINNKTLFDRRLSFRRESFLPSFFANHAGFL